MTAKVENIFEVVIYNQDGFTERDYFQVRDEVISSKPDYWQLFQPSEIISFFVQRKNGKERSDNLVSRIRQLKKTSPLFAHLGVGVSQIKPIVDIDFFGKMKSEPIGGSLEASNNAKKDAATGVAG